MNAIVDVPDESSPARCPIPNKSRFRTSVEPVVTVLLVPEGLEGFANGVMTVPLNGPVPFTPLRLERRPFDVQNEDGRAIGHDFFNRCSFVGF